MTLKTIATLKKMLSSHAILELRMCNVGSVGEQEEENGPVFAQKLANLLGRRIKVFTEKVNPYGGKHVFWFFPANYDIYAPDLEK